MSEKNTDIKSLAHTKWNCKYHVVFASKYRKKVFYNEKWEDIQENIRTLCRWKQIEIIEGEVCPGSYTFQKTRGILELDDAYLPNIYLKYYLFQDYVVKHSDKNYTRMNEVMDGREKDVFTACRKVAEDGRFRDDLFDVDNHATFIVDLETGIANNTNERMLLITENKGAIANFFDSYSGSALSGGKEQYRAAGHGWDFQVPEGADGTIDICEEDGSGYHGLQVPIISCGRHWLCLRLYQVLQ